MGEDEMDRQHHCLNGHKFEQNLGEREGQRNLGFPNNSVGKESTCNAGDPG